jgi:hypothetical protein
MALSIEGIENGYSVSGQAVLINRIVAMAMVATGLMYPFAPEVGMIAVLHGMLGSWGFFGWCAVMAGFGMLLFLHPDEKQIFILTAPLLVFVVATMVMAVNGDSLTAMIYYVSVWLFPNYFAYRRMVREDGDSYVVRALRRFEPRWVFGSILLTMALVLWIRPYGSGLEYTYNFLAFLGDPVLAYRLMFLIGGLGMVIPRLKSSVVVGLLGLPMYVHGGIFVWVIVTDTYLWALLPLFLGNSLLWITAIEEA